MRVVHCIKATGIAGAERHLLVLLQGLRARQIDAQVIVLVEPDNPVEEYFQRFRDAGVPVRREVVHHHMDVTLYWRLRRLFRELKPDMVHTHLWHADLFGIPAARLAFVRRVITSRHNDDAFRYRRSIRLVNRLLWRMVSAGITISEAIARFSIEVEGAPRARLRTIHYGIEHRPYSGQQSTHSALRKELGLPDDVLLVGMVCRLTEQKGVTYGLQAFARLQDDFPSAHLVIAGNGPLRSALEAEAKTLGVRAHFLGWRSDVGTIMEALDIFLMPSLWEGFGLVLLEAMAHQLPIVGSAVSAIPEVVAQGESGILVPPRDVDGLAAALRSLLGDRILRRYMGLVGEDRLETYFNAEQMVERTIALYSELLSFRKPQDSGLKPTV
jgi:glycosyltransferase involved in cell wall biosynthesis